MQNMEMQTQFTSPNSWILRKVQRMLGAGFLLLALPLVIFPAACGGGPSSDSISIRLVDHFRPEMVEGAPVEVKEPEPLAVWDFGEPEPETPPEEAPQTRGWKSGVGVSGLAIREGRLRGRSNTDFPIIYIKRAKGLEEKDLVHSVEIRMRATKGTNLSISGQGPEDPDFKQILAMAKGFPWPDTTPIIAGDTFQTYTLPLLISVRSSDLHYLLVRPTDASGAAFEIESIRLVSRKEHLARIPSGLSWQGLAEIYRETLVSRSPESIRMELQLPDNPRLDLHIGTVEYPPVTFKVKVAPAGANPAQGMPLLERTVTTPHRWESVPIDLADYAGQKVTLSLSLEAQSAGTLGFWGGPVVRDGGKMSPLAGQRPSVNVTTGSGTEPPQGIILILADTLRKDHLSFYGYGRETAPVLSRMAVEGALFLDPIVQATWTKVSAPSIMTSLYPTSHRVAEFSDRLSATAVTLAEVYRNAGYATVAYSSVLFTGKFTNMHQGFEELHESSSVADRESSKTAREYVDRLSVWLEDHRDVPFFVFLHVFDPHDPYEPYQPYNSLWADPSKKAEHQENLRKVREVIQDPLMKRFGMPTRDELRKAGIDPQEYVSRDIDWYDGSILALDVEIGRLQERLRGLGLTEKTLIVFASDHGEEFLDHDRMFHGQSVYGELTGVPLILYRPGAVPAGVVINETVQSIDLMPTILELSHLPRPEGLLGQSLLPLMAAARDAKAGSSTVTSLAEAAAAYGWSKRAAISEKAAAVHMGAPPPRETESFSVVQDGWKLIHNTKRPDGKPEFELYHHAEDPLNLNDLAAENPQIVKRLVSELESWRKIALAAQLPEADSTEGLSKEELERLRSLGYIQ
ncbi:sulfatase [Acidobacteria bacterium AH-259-G07]|nr:sulfatase [Acidobacteria bacterium AH-259-G07]